MWNPVNNNQCGVHQYSRNPNRGNFRFLSPMESYDLSIFENTSPPHRPSFNTIRRALQYEDSDSEDSGYEATYPEVRNFPANISPIRTSLFLNSNSVEDEAIDISYSKSPEKPRNLPQGFDQLIKNPSVPLSFQSTNTGIVPCRKPRPNLLKTRSTKRSAPPIESEISRNIKRLKIVDHEGEVVPETVPILLRPVSTKETIMCALQKSSSELDLIGDFSKAFSLPLVTNNYQDLKTITPTTLARLIKGDYNDMIESFKLVDCRYPYEYDGGHIEGAVNIYTEEQCLELLEAERVPVQSSSGRRHILVFHCEFSIERGPNLYRYLRKEDRHRNEAFYPYLYYPEMYLLEGGYKQFYEQFSKLCVPVGYKTMLHQDHKEDLRRFKQKFNVQQFKHARNLKKQRLEL